MRRIRRLTLAMNVAFGLLMLLPFLILAGNVTIGGIVAFVALTVILGAGFLRARAARELGVSPEVARAGEIDPFEEFRGETPPYLLPTVWLRRLDLELRARLWLRLLTLALGCALILVVAALCVRPGAF